MGLRAAKYAYLQVRPGSEPPEDMISALAEADPDEVAHVLCGAACVIAAAGRSDVAADVLRVIDQSGAGFKGWPTPAVLAATALDRILGLRLGTFADLKPLNRELKQAAMDQWTQLPWPAGLWQDLAGDALLRRGLWLVQQGDSREAQAVMRAYLNSGTGGFQVSKARRVLLLLLLGEDSDEVVDVLADEVDREGLALLADIDVLRFVIERRPLTEVFGFEPDGLASAAAELVARGRSQLRAGSDVAGPGWPRLVPKWLQYVDAYLEAEGLADLRPSHPGHLRSGASEDALANADRRLGVVLPPSYRSFLQATNGLDVGGPNFIGELLPVEAITWFAEANPDWVQAYTAGNDVTLTDDQYFVYGAAQDCVVFRPEYLRTALQISAEDDGVVWLLVPDVVFDGGEWEAWELGNHKPGADRFRSFAELVAHHLETLEAGG